MRCEYNDMLRDAENAHTLTERLKKKGEKFLRSALDRRMLPSRKRRYPCPMLLKNAERKRSDVRKKENG